MPLLIKLIVCAVKECFGKYSVSGDIRHNNSNNYNITNNCNSKNILVITVSQEILNTILSKINQVDCTNI